MDDNDRDALQRAFDLARHDPALHGRVDRWLAERGWESAARSCACHCQSAALNLKPWQLPPCSPTIANHLDDALRVPFSDASGRREGAEIVRKLRSLGLSIYEADPLAAIARVEAGQRQAVK
ncbi:hypothetical protein [Bradyrhizobium cytisi]|uniref:Uncharacterized protein n=1 Tax=Bradyrhizobium cytisi TaxID=515489 RepID=A0A5S4X8A0_9BRAD|nr:hypothetical protein [Bradyrhizobium cytisi]TYL85714.1 hypothetical protein FXB38_09150 [Bradyrhizobium cytisi]